MFTFTNVHERISRTPLFVCGFLAHAKIYTVHARMIFIDFPRKWLFFRGHIWFPRQYFLCISAEYFWINENSRSEILFHEYLIDYSICLSPTVYHPSATSLYNLERLQGPTVTISPKAKYEIHILRKRVTLNGEFPLLGHNEDWTVSI